MTRITGCYNLDLAPANDDILIQKDQWDGMKFLGFQPIKWTPGMKTRRALNEFDLTEWLG